MTYWNTDNPNKPWGLMDPNAQIDIPFDWSQWLAELGVDHASHQVLVESPLELVATQVNQGVVTAFVKVADGGTVQLGHKYAVTCRITTTGDPARTDDRTVYLKMQER